MKALGFNVSTKLKAHPFQSSGFRFCQQPAPLQRVRPALHPVHQAQHGAQAAGFRRRHRPRAAALLRRPGGGSHLTPGEEVEVEGEVSSSSSSSSSFIIIIIIIISSSSFVIIHHSSFVLQHKNGPRIYLNTAKRIMRWLSNIRSSNIRCHCLCDEMERYPPPKV